MRNRPNGAEVISSSRAVEEKYECGRNGLSDKPANGRRRNGRSEGVTRAMLSLPAAAELRRAGECRRHRAAAVGDPAASGLPGTGKALRLQRRALGLEMTLAGLDPAG